MPSALSIRKLSAADEPMPIGPETLTQPPEPVSTAGGSDGRPQ